ncbi:hypothetical protein CLOACE_02990 [Clostridium acetireducens DSM 10703]|uniref:Uncharacterized protein n=1 Tax=Clostridium acetireducens DSM 10703 TaxID=1121290 RepID=A0A1E8F1I3_9CLOT|nr:hypothetical protein [Clostridium acetireducens]OFI07470.1 hypothetical protein CLOACE_02990 [Clostridium acetireducens DSM 10703]
MPVGVRFAKIEQNNLSKELGKKEPISQQLNIWGQEDFQKEGYIEYIGKGEFGDYDKFKIAYYVIEKITGYYKEARVENLLVEEEKFFYVAPDNSYILIRASKKDSYKIINLLQKSGQVDIGQTELDMKELREKLSQDKSKIKSIVGAWITNLEDVNINTVAIFGTEVDQSDEFGDYVSQEESKISMLIIDFGEETIAITHEFGAIFYNRRSELKLLEGYEIVKRLLSSLDMFL